jgi:magnesium-transporting ATPase (P-type)
MDILDNPENFEPKVENEAGRKLAYFSVIFYVIAAIAAIVAFYGALLARAALYQAGAPDAVKLSNAIVIVMYGQYTSMFTSLISIILHRIAFIKYDYSKPWLWRILLICSCITLFSTVYPVNIILTVLSLVTIVHLLFKRQFYTES